MERESIFDRERGVGGDAKFFFRKEEEKFHALISPTVTPEERWEGYEMSGTVTNWTGGVGKILRNFGKETTKASGLFSTVRLPPYDAGFKSVIAAMLCQSEG